MTLLEATAAPASLRPDVEDQANALAEAFDTPVSVWTRGETGWEEVGRAPWNGVAAEAPLDESAAQEALATGSVVLSAETDPAAGATFAAPIACRDRSEFVAVGAATIGRDQMLTRFAGAVLSEQRRVADYQSLRDENNTYAVQLSSDLEELSFLRAVVARLKDTAAATELTGMARETLPVLNDTVRARCLAFLVAEDPAEPLFSRVAYRIGATEPSDQALAEAVSQFGARAMRGPFVWNWDGADARPDGAETGRPPEIRSLVICPLESSGELFGWLVAANRRPTSGVSTESSWQLASNEFGSGEATLIATSASILAMHAANLEMIREKEEIIVNVVRSLVAAIDSKDPYTRGHSERVALYTRRIAEEMGCFEDESERIYLSGLLHDVGKIGVSDETLKKPGKLTDEEFAEIAKHPDEGWAILCDLQQLAYVLPGVLHHHERWDGEGYPDGLAGEAIPIEGRIMAVADAFDAMTSDRAYRQGMPNEKAQAILREGAGTQWDPACVEAFFACLDDIHAIQTGYEQRVRRQRSRGAEAPADA